MYVEAVILLEAWIHLQHNLSSLQCQQPQLKADDPTSPIVQMTT